MESACQDLLRGILHGVLHEERIGDWYREAASIDRGPRAYHEVLPAVLRNLDGVDPQQGRRFAAAPNEERLAEWVVQLYALCRHALPKSDHRILVAPTPAARLPCNLPRKVRRLADHFTGRDDLRLLLHGSLATCDPTPFSDVDTLLFVGDSWLATAESLERLRRIIREAQRWLYLQDPTQHHGFMVVTELDLTRYAHHYFPLELLSFTFALTPCGRIEYRPRPSSAESRGLLERVCRRVERLASDPLRAPATRYALKSVLSELMLLPSYYLQTRGEVLYKRDSFAAVRPHLSEHACHALDTLSDWRRGWRLSPWDRAYRTLGEWMPRPLATRALARVRAHPISSADRARWIGLLPCARALARELLALASAPRP